MCNLKEPPGGRKIYAEKDIVVHEVDGESEDKTVKVVFYFYLKFYFPRIMGRWRIGISINLNNHDILGLYTEPLFVLQVFPRQQNDLLWFARIHILRFKWVLMGYLFIMDLSNICIGDFLGSICWKMLDW